MSCCGNCKFNEWCPDKAEDIKWCIEKSHLNIAYEQGKADAMQTSVSILMGIDKQVAYLFENIVKNAEHYNKRKVE